MTALPSSTPASVRRLIARCLERDVRQRLRDIGEARIVLTDPTPPAGDVVAVPILAPPPPLWRRAIPIVLAAIVAGGLAGAVTLYLRPAKAPLVVTRFSFTPAAGQVFPTGTRHFLDISPDGTQIACSVSGVGLYLRSMKEARLAWLCQPARTPKC